MNDITLWTVEELVQSVQKVDPHCAEAIDELGRRAKQAVELNAALEKAREWELKCESLAKGMMCLVLGDADGMAKVADEAAGRFGEVL